MKQANVKNSVNSPLRIDSVKVPSTDGVIGMTFCPGKKDPYSPTGPWERDLETDLQAIREWGAEAVVTLMEEFELDFLHVSDLPEKVRRFGMRWFFLPIGDVSIPDNHFESNWQTAGGEIRQILRAGGKLLFTVEVVSAGPAPSPPGYWWNSVWCRMRQYGRCERPGPVQSRQSRRRTMF
jgi:hypothetical protein